MVPPARKRWNPIQRGSVAKIEVSPQPECVLIKSRGKGERLSIPRELFATFRFFKRPSNRGGGIGKGGKKKKKERKERKKRREERLMDAYERGERYLRTRAPVLPRAFLCRGYSAGGASRDLISRCTPFSLFHHHATGSARETRATAK